MRKTRSIDWPVRALPLLTAAVLVLTSCGSPQPSVTIRNVVDSTAQPAQVSAASPSAQVPATAMPGMPESTKAAQASSAAPQGSTANAAGPTPTDFVAAWVLFGTPTPGSGSANSASAGAVPATTVAQATTPVPTQVATTAAQPTTAPTTQSAAAAGPTATTGGSTGTSGGSAASSGDPARGKIVFNTAGCTACHDVTNGITIVGPSLKGVASRAGSRKPGMTAEAYLHESILTPNAFIVPGFQPGIMLQNFGQTLSSQQLNDLIAYLMTLK